MTGIGGDDGEAALEAYPGKRSRLAADRRRHRAVVATAALIEKSSVPLVGRRSSKRVSYGLPSAPVRGAAEPRTTQWAGCVGDPAS